MTHKYYELIKTINTMFELVQYTDLQCSKKLSRAGD